jgi:hypothetical protein
LSNLTSATIHIPFASSWQNKSWRDGEKKHVNEALSRHGNKVIKSLKQLFKGKECAFCFGRGNIFHLLVLTTASTQKKYLDSTVM